jgi:dihydroneopterin aldolase
MTDATWNGDRIEIRGITGIGYHGVFPEERRDGQEFRVDVVLSTDMRRAAASDDLADTVDYGTIAQAVHAVITGEPVDLIETLAHRIADVCLEPAGVERVEVAVHKPQAPIPVPFDDVIVRVIRNQAS